MLLMNIKEMLKYENAEIIQMNMKMASVLCRNFPSSIQRVNKYIDIISSLFIIKGNVESRIITVKSRKRPETNIEISATFLKSFLFFKNGTIKNKYRRPPYANIFWLPSKNVVFTFWPSIGYNLLKFKFFSIPAKITIRLNNIIGIITLKILKHLRRIWLLQVEKMLLHLVITVTID